MSQEPDLFQQPPQERLAEFHVHNQKLFSSYSLAYKLPERSLWRELEARAQRAFEHIKKAYRDMAAANLFSAKNEAETERVFIRPTFKALGFDYFSVQPALDSYDARRWPDYALFPDQESYEVAQHNRENMRIFYGKAVAIGEAKYWARPMNDPDPSDPADISDATKQLVSYLRDVAEWTDGKTNWGILTNGKLWRLFHRRADYTAESYVEIDLEAIIQEDNFEAFKYFYALFSHEAFVIQPLEGISWLESYLKGSEDYATGITKHLKELIFEKVFDGLVQGFVQYRREKLGITHEDEASKRAIFQGCLTLLYRLLFLLNAESRQLLPMDNRDYRERSLRALMERIWEERSEKRTEYDFDYWHHLKRLFNLIDNGAPEFNLPRYNGGLFKRPDPNVPLDRLKEEEIGPWFLEKHELADPYLRDAIEQLTFAPEVPTPNARAFIDYSSLGVRHLGEIYEGLLEFKIEIAEDEPVCAVGSKKRPQWKKQSEVTDEDTVHFIKQIGEPYITNDKGERKATGSYYTPHYIVQYIVEHTVSPQLDRFEREKEWYDQITSDDADLPKLYEEIMAETATESERERLDALWQSCRDSEERRKFLINHLDPDPEVDHNFDPATRAFRLKVLDPAMGSGHFLVHAVDVIADRVADFLNKYPDSTVVEQLGRLRAGILENVHQQGVKIDESKLNDVNLIKRMVMKRCIYGVDLNPMAVELAKLSLWLDSFTVGAPLSFLDHHLRCGNSLIGATVEEVRTALEGEKKGPDFHLSLLTSQFTGLMRAVELMQQVGRLSDATIPELEESQTRYERAIAELAPFKAILDVWISEYFGNDSAQAALKQTPEAVEKAIHHLLGRSDHLDNKSEATLQLVQEALRISKERRFFHWELEFPEVWYKGGERRSSPGFDAVIGNPPYVNANELNKLLSKFEKPFWKDRFESASGAYDLYVLFLEQAIKLTRKQGLCSLITPNKFLAAPYAVSFREYFHRSAKLLRLLNVSHVKVFEDPSIYPVVTITEHCIPEENYHILVDWPLVKEHELISETIHQDSEHLGSLPDKIWGFLISEYLPLILKAQSISSYLSNISTVRASSTTSEADAYEKALTNSDGSNNMKYVNTGLIDRYTILWGEIPLTHKRKSFINPYLQLGSSLVPKERVKQYRNPKIIFAKIAKRIEACLDQVGEYASANTNFVYDSPYGLRYLLAILNSQLINRIYEGYFGALRMSGGYFQFQAPQLKVLPIRRIFFTTPNAERERQVEKLQTLYQQRDFDQLLEAVEACLPKDNDGKSVVLSNSISVEQAIEKGFLTEEQAESWAFEPDDPSGYDENGNPLERSDVVHDLLAYLAECMIEMNKDKHEIIEKFWTDLEGVTDSETFKKLRKGKQEKTLANRSEACRPFVNEESGSTKHLDESLAWSKDAFKDFAKLLAGRIGNLSELVEIYRKHGPAYKQLVDRIEATDELIDQIVYKLYGLTEEGIMIVEGKGKTTIDENAWNDLGQDDLTNAGDRRGD